MSHLFIYFSSILDLSGANKNQIHQELPGNELKQNHNHRRPEQ